jgi:hypothetical protein
MNPMNPGLITDSTGGTASQTLSATTSTYNIVIPISLLSQLANAQAYSIIPGFSGVLNSLAFRVGNPATTGSKAATMQAQVNGSSLTGGVIGLTSANCTPTGATVAGSAITAGTQTFTASQTIGVLLSSVTAFVEGNGWLELNVTDTDLNNTIASLAAKINQLSAQSR